MTKQQIETIDNEVWEKGNIDSLEWFEIVDEVRNVSSIMYPDGITGDLKGDFVLL